MKVDEHLDAALAANILQINDATLWQRAKVDECDLTEVAAKAAKDDDEPNKVAEEARRKAKEDCRVKADESIEVARPAKAGVHCTKMKEDGEVAHL